MIIVQERWTAAEPGHLRQLLQAALPAGSRGHGPPELVLLPIGEHVPGLDESVALGAVRDAASGCGAVLAGALRLDVGTIGFLMAADGQLLLRTPKILPDWAEGYSDTPSALAEPAAFGIVKLPQGQVAMLVGEDATAAHLVRAAMWRGAEVVLNPSREFTDEQFGIRQQARMARAYENHLCLVTASPSSLARGGGFEERLPPASALYDEWALPVRASGAESFLRVSLDVEAVRRRRSEYFGNLCVSTRPTIYAPGYRAALGPATTARASSPARVVDWIAEGERRALARAAAHPRRSDAIDRYDILLGQVIPRHVTDATSAAAVISANVDHAIDLTCRFAAAPDTRLVVFPEFFLQGSRMGRMPQLFPIAGINLKSSPHIDRLARFAQDNRMHLCGAVLEIDDDWPGHLFNTAFILDDRGVLIHRYRKIQCADVFGFLDTTPAASSSAISIAMAMRRSSRWPIRGSAGSRPRSAST
jgi:predicted amidohydrolase